MEHVAFLLKIDPRQEAEYRKRHEHVDPELEEQFGKVGIRSYHIFFHEGTLFAHMEVENFESAMAQLAVHPANVKWQHFMSDLLQAWDNGDAVKNIPCVYSYLSI